MLGFRLKPFAYVVTIAVGVFIALLIRNGKPMPAEKAETEYKAPIVNVVPFEAGENQLWVGSQGVLEPSVKTQLVAQVAGNIALIGENFKNGERFEEGEVLLEIDDQDYRIAIAQAKAKAADARQLLAIEKGRARQAKREWRDLGSEEANALFLRKPQLASAEAALVAAQAGVEKAELDLKRTQISVPYAGQVLQKNVEVGQYVTIGSMLGEVFDTRRAELRLPLTSAQRYLLGDSLNKPVQLYTSVMGKRHFWEGRFVRFEAAVDTQSRQFFAVVQFDNPFFETKLLSGAQTESAALRPTLAVGQYLQVDIPGRIIANSYLIPRKALRQPSQLWLVDAKQRLQVVNVQVLQSNAKQAVVQLERAVSCSDKCWLITSELSQAITGTVVQLAHEVE